MGPFTNRLRPIAHIGGLWAVALAQPFFDTLGRSPEFFVAHRATAFDIVALTALVALVPPLVLGVVAVSARAAGRQVGNVASAVAIGLLAGLIALQAGYRAGVESWPAAVAILACGTFAAAGAWLRVRHFGAFLTVLSPAAIVVPVLFLSGSGVRALVFQRPASPPTAASSSAAIPVVLVVFDELPLVSLLDDAGLVDRGRYPNIAALAADGIWFRNATAVADFTTWAVPAILTGQHPRVGAVPTWSGHPNNLFTLLAGTHRMEVVENSTALCPEDLCRQARESSTAGGLRGVLADLRVVAAHLLLPPVARKGLPDLSQDWAGFDGNDDGTPVSERGDRAHARRYALRELLLRFLNRITSRDPQPTLYFIHSVISHRPALWLPSGQAIASQKSIPGQLQFVWANDAWPIAQHYQRHLWQLGFVDSVVGRLRERLEEAGLYERALVVFMADHGISYTPGRARRLFSDEAAGEILPVPFIVKLPAGAPGPPPGTIDDRNVQTIDILPTIASVLGLDVPWPIDGISVFDQSRSHQDKVIFFNGATQTRRLATADVVRSMRQALDRKLALFGTGRLPLLQVPVLGALLNRRVETLTVQRDRRGLRAFLDSPSMFAAVDLDAPELPVEVRGRIDGAPAADTPLYLVVALNGTVVATTQSWPGEMGWMAALPPDRLREGRNHLEVFVVDPAEPDTLVGPLEPPPVLDLALAPPQPWRIRRAGFYGPASRGGRPVRWTNGQASIKVPTDAIGSPSSLTIEVLTAGRAGKRLRVLLEDCQVLDETLPRGQWSRTVPLGACRPAKRRARIQLLSDTHLSGGKMRRPLGVAVSRLTLQ